MSEEAESLWQISLERLRRRAEEIYVEEFSGGIPIENQTLVVELSVKDMAKAYEQALQELLRDMRRS